MQEKLITATKREIDCDYVTVNSSQKKVYIQVSNVSLIEVASIFGNPAETVQLWFGNLYLAYYTRLESIMPGVRSIRVVLGKE